jgi:hydroxymethylglutaryl-CoA reductase
MDELSLEARRAIKHMNLPKLGMIMNMNHGYLNTLSVSSPEVEELVTIARSAGALGAKLTGGGGGGAIVALCDSAEMQQRVQAQIEVAGYESLITEIKASISSNANN